MAKSIRISDALYAAAQQAGEALGRPLAQQMEFWARLGAAMDLAGITSEQALQIQRGDATLKARLLATLTADGAVRGPAAAQPVPGQAALAAAHARAERAVRAGDISPENLFTIPRALTKSAKLSYAPENASGKQGW